MEAKYRWNVWKDAQKSFVFNMLRYCEKCATLQVVTEGKPLTLTTTVAYPPIIDHITEKKRNMLSILMRKSFLFSCRTAFDKLLFHELGHSEQKSFRKRSDHESNTARIAETTIPGRRIAPRAVGVTGFNNGNKSTDGTRH
jgi:hypothetical protein